MNKTITRSVFMRRLSIMVLCELGSFFTVRAAMVSNPIIWADIPDISIVLAGNKYYMSQTTMHMTPGVPIMESSDLVHWKTISHCYSVLADNDMLNLANGKDAYGKGSWASSIRYNNGTFHVLVPSQTSGHTHLYTTDNLHNGTWKETLFPLWHDPSLVLDDDGRKYVLFGNGNISIVELNADLSGVKTGGLSKVILTDAGSIAGSGGLGAEGTQVYKHNNYYYLFNICWPSGSMRTQLCYRGKSLSGAFEGKVVLKSNGVAQGSILQMRDSTWVGYLFQDNGSVGRSPWIVPVTWKDDWPVFNNGTAPAGFTLPAVGPAEGTGVVTSDGFTGDTLKPEWQTNHNPDNANRSLTARPGFFRIKTGRIDKFVTQARNSLTQRSFGPKCSGRVRLEVSGLKDGDYAGLCALQSRYGIVGVRRSEGTTTIVMLNGTTEVASAPLSQNSIYLRIDMDFTNRNDRATFYYSLDSTTWRAIGNTLQMSYDIPHFMGYRFALFNYATKTTGGTADFDWFEIGSSVAEKIDLYPDEPVALLQPGLPRTSSRFMRIEEVDPSLLKISCQLAFAGRATFYLYDTRGHLVDRISDGALNPGNHTINCRVPALTRGYYVVQGSVDGKIIGACPLLRVR